MFSMITLINLFKLMLIFMVSMNILLLNKVMMMNYQIVFMFNETFMNFYNNMTMVFDIYSMSFFAIVTTVVFNVLSFMNIYMNKNTNMKIFFFMTKMFILSMFILIHSFNLWTMILGWEGLGVSSFYLIFYYNNFESWKSAIKTFINNKMGDCMILLAMIFFVMNDTNKMMTLFFLLSMLTKSAQYPFMAWLPMAMSAPTPISAMVHSSTLVTAGLFIMFRLMNVFLMKINMNIIMNLCLLSMFISGMKALTEKDMKKMIALSTLSQISLIFFFLLMNLKILAFIYMCNHALFKSLMFINMGMMMNSNFSSQLNFSMNNLNLSTINILSYKIACLNLMNMSFFSSFFVKEKMMLSMQMNFFSSMKFMIFLINSFFTMNYSMKMIFFFNSNNFKKKFNSFNNSNYMMSFFLMNLLSIFFSKMSMYFFLFNSMMNLTIMIFYLFSMVLNFKIYKNKYFLVTSMVYLNFMVYIYPFVMKKSMDTYELWMEKISLNFYFFLKNKLLYKSFNMNYNMIMILLMLIMFI